MGQLQNAVKEWILSELGAINEVQKITIPRIIADQHTLVMAPTGAGKTLAAFLGIISELVKMETENSLEKKIYALYVSPLKALNNDIQKNLQIPLQSIANLHNSKIQAAIRTGDTTSKERARMLNHPPHILITTPESLALMLTAPRFKENLRDIRWVIIDEIHALADNKRGSMLSICLERLDYHMKNRTTRIGLSATVEPPEVVARFLVGNKDASIGLIRMQNLRKLEIKVIAPTKNMVHAAMATIQKRHQDIISEVIHKNKTTLIFANTRHWSERLAIDIIKQNPGLEEFIAVHHGSLSKNVRLDVENRLKEGKMRAVFTSTSLELGIDIGSIDATAQLGSPKTIRSFTQRIGRSGHSQNLNSKGIIVVFDRDDLIECMAIAKLSALGRIDKLRIPEAPLDMLFQLIVSMAIENRWSVKEAHKIITGAYPYRNLSIEKFREVLTAAAETTKDDNSWKYALIWYDPEIQEFGRRRKARQAFMQNVGAIPDVAMVDVVLETYRTRIGQVADRFSEHLNSGDVFVLGGRSYQYIRSVGSKIIVSEAFGKVPTIPGWIGEAKTRSEEVSIEIGYMYDEIGKFIEKEENEKAIIWLAEEYHCTKVEANAVLNYILEQIAVGVLPSTKRLVVEEYIDPTGAKMILMLSLFGRETNLVLAQALGTKIGQELSANISTTATDNGILLRLPFGIDYDHRNLLNDFNAVQLVEALLLKIRSSEMFKNRFRHVAGRSLMVLKQSGPRKNSVDNQIKLARWLLKKLPEDYPIIKETIREIVYDTFNLEVAKNILKKVENGQIEVVFSAGGSVPSPFTHSILLNDNKDVVTINDKRSLLLNLHQQVLSRILPKNIANQSIFDKITVDEYFTSKLNVMFTNDKDLSLHRFAEIPQKYDNFIKSAMKSTGINEDDILQIVENSKELVPWQNGYKSHKILPYILTIQSRKVVDNLDSSFKNMVKRSNELSPDVAIEYLVTYLLRYSGPLTIDEISQSLKISEKKITPILSNMVRRHTVLLGSFTHTKQQYLLFEDRDALQDQNSEEINLAKLAQYRMIKMRLDKRYQSERMTIYQYLEENGPARDTVELVSRLPGFDWVDLRDSLALKEIYFGRFLAGRLVFIAKSQLSHFITLYRNREIVLEETVIDLLQLIQLEPGMTIREIQKYIPHKKNEIQQMINQLESELYISRVGWNLSLTQGGFPNPRYIPLPSPKITDISYNISVKWIIQSCVSWYGPLTLQDFLRITRVPYPILEYNLKRVKLVQREIYSYNHYGKEDDFSKIPEVKETEDTIFLLSPLDPYFYMIAGSLRYDHLPRQSRLMLVKNGKTAIRVEIALPDKDSMQVLNIQIPRRYMQDYEILKILGSQLLRVARRAFQGTVVFIEEINFQAASHTDNKHVIQAMKESGYFLLKDQLIGGTYANQLNHQDLLETRLLNHFTSKSVRHKTIDSFLEEVETIEISNATNKLDMDEGQAKLLLTRAIRQGKLHHRGGLLYHPLFWEIKPQDDENFKYNKIFENHETVSFSELLSLTGDDRKTINDNIALGYRRGLIENISPFSQSQEFRKNNTGTKSRREQLVGLINRVIQRFGPLSFDQLQTKVKLHIESSRIEILLILTDLLKKNLYSSVIQMVAHPRIFYYNKHQDEILGDPVRSERMPKWLIVSNESLMLEDTKSGATHFVAYFAHPLVELHVKTKIDIASIENITFLPGFEKIAETLTELISVIEEHFFEQGFNKIVVKRIQSSYADFWIKT